MDKTTAINKMIAIAQAEIGYLEKASNANLDSKTGNTGSNNYTKYWRDVKPEWNGQAWCACFITWVLDKAFGKSYTEKLLKHYPYVYVPTLMGKFTRYANPEKGDIVCFYRNGAFTHTGIVIGVNGDYFETIEGNTSGASGVIANGGGVCKKGYYNSQLPGTKFARLDWSILSNADSTGSATSGSDSLDGYSVGDYVTVSTYYAASTDPTSKAIYPKQWVCKPITKIVKGAKNPYLLGDGFAWCNKGDIRGKGDLTGNQSKPATSSGNKIAVDGQWGTATTKKAQAVFGTGSDGIVSNQLSCYRGICAGVVGSFHWEGTKRGGSALIKAIQRKIGVTPDGYIGPGTIKAMQRWLGCTQDGYFSNPSTCIREFQRWLNEQ